MIEISAGDLSEDHLEAARVIDSFDYFCEKYVFIHDKKARKAIKFARYPCQVRMSELLVNGDWIAALKARQLGLTWLLAAYCLWRLLTVPGFEACVLQQNRDYAKDFLKRIKFMYRRLPEWLQVPIASDARYELAFNHGFGDEASLRVIAGSDTAGRSISGDLMVFDEHAYIPDAKAARQGCEPAVEISGGQVVCLTTSSGPQGDFYDTWKGAPGNKYVPVFFGWDEHPDRDQAWYDAEAARHKGDRLFMGREYPSSSEEAFAHAEGRCYPSFSNKNIGDFDVIGLLKDDAELYRSIDFGSVHPYVCLWVAHWEKEPTGMTVNPACVETIREFMSYRFDRTYAQGRERPKKIDDHAMDAIRYLIIHLELAGHIHIFRELYIPNSVQKGRTDLTDIDDIHKLSGWVECDEHERNRYKPGKSAEYFVSTVCDRSQRKAIDLYCINDIPAEAYSRPEGSSASTEVLDGIRRLNVMIDGTRTIFKQRTEDPARRRYRSALDVAASKDAARDPRKERLRAKRRANRMNYTYR